MSIYESETSDLIETTTLNKCLSNGNEYSDPTLTDINAEAVALNKKRKLRFIPKRLFKSVKLLFKDDRSYRLDVFIPDSEPVCKSLSAPHASFVSKRHSTLIFEDQIKACRKRSDSDYRL